MPVRSDVHDRVVVHTSIQSQSTATAAVNGASVDMRSYPGYRVMAVVNVGNWTDGELTFTVEDSADDSSFATLSPVAGSLGAIAADNVTDTASYVPVAGRPYLRIVSAESSAVSTALPFSAHLVLIPPALV